MHFFLAALAGATLSVAQNTLDFASFGHKHGLSPDRDSLPSWSLGGSTKPQVLSDKVILTPPYPGNQQGSLWTQERTSNPQWSVDLKFRVTGDEHGGGNFQIWYTKEHEAYIGSNSIYTIDKFEGLAIVVDMHGGPGGGIRGFLNDGTTSFKNHHHIETLAFGHCDYSYRNLGRPTRLQIIQDSTGFEVRVDDKSCFRSDSVLLPSGYFFGLTAASSARPDSVEIFKFITTTPSTVSSPPQSQGEAQQQTRDKVESGGPKIEPELLKDVLASSIESSQSQFEDLHNRIQSQGHNIERLFSEFIKSTAQTQGRIEELHSKLARFDQVRTLESKVDDLHRELLALRKEVEGKDYTGHFNDIHKSVKARHDALIENLPETLGHVITSRAPRMGLYILLIVGFQLGLAGAYVLYKRRRDAAPKKYL